MTSPNPIPLFTKIDIVPPEEHKISISGRMAAYLHNLKIEVAEAKLALRYNPKDPVSFAQGDALLDGQMRLLEQIELDTQISE